MKNKRNKKNILIIFFISSLLGLPFFAIQKGNAITSADCDQLSGSNEAACEALERKAQAYQDLIDIKNKQQNTLQKQIQSIDAEQARNQTEFQKTQKDVSEYTNKTESIQKEITYKENLIAYQKMLLSKLLQSYYEYYQDGVLKFVLIDGDFASTFNQTDRIKQIGTSATDLLRDIQKNKEELNAEYADVQERKIQSENLKANLQDKKETLLATESQKQSLLSQTQGEEAKYQKLLERVEAQKLELLDFSTASNLDDVIGSVSSYKKPDKKYWDSSNFYSQKDDRWGNKKIGGTKYLMKDYGCAVTSVAMAYRFDGDNYSPQTILTRADFTSQALIYWPNGWKKMAFNSSIVDKQLDDDKAVIVHIRKGNTAGHFVVIHHKDDNYKNLNDYIVHDPYFGSNLYLGTSRSLVGKLGTNGPTTIDSMIIY